MRAVACLALLAACGTVEERSDLPEGYETVYRQDFATKGTRHELHVSDADAWAWRMDGEDPLRATYMEIGQRSDYSPPHRSPTSIALIAGIEVGSFIYELDVWNTAPVSRGAHRDLCFFFNFQDPANFYYCHLAPGPDEHAHNVFLVDDAARRRIADVAEEGITWDRDQYADGNWHRVRIERDLESGLIRVSFDGEVVIETTDTTHGVGRMGFGTFDDSGWFTNVEIHSPDGVRVEHENPFE